METYKGLGAPKATPVSERVSSALDSSAEKDVDTKKMTTQYESEVFGGPVTTPSYLVSDDEFAPRYLNSREWNEGDRYFHGDIENPRFCYGKRVAPGEHAPWLKTKVFGLVAVPYVKVGSLPSLGEGTGYCWLNLNPSIYHDELRECGVELEDWGQLVEFYTKLQIPLQLGVRLRVGELEEGDIRHLEVYGESAVSSAGASAVDVMNSHVYRSCFWGGHAGSNIGRSVEVSGGESHSRIRGSMRIGFPPTLPAFHTWNVPSLTGLLAALIAFHTWNVPSLTGLISWYRSALTVLVAWVLSTSLRVSLLWGSLQAWDVKRIPERRDKLFWYIRFLRRNRCSLPRSARLSMFRLTRLAYPSTFSIGARYITQRSCTRAIRVGLVKTSLFQHSQFAHLIPGLLPPQVIREVERAGHNRLMHATNGNIERIEKMERSGGQMLHVSGEVSTHADPRLGGAMVVLSELLYGDRPSSNNMLTADSLPREMLLQPITLNNVGIAGRNGWIRRQNVYIQSYPANSGRLPTQVEESTEFEVITEAGNLPTQVVDRAPFRANRELTGSNFLAFDELSALWTRQQDPDALKSVENILSRSRFTGVRGNRQVLGWDAHAPSRQQALHNLAMVDQQGSSYYRFFWRLWSAYLTACLAEADRDGNQLEREPLLPAHLDYNDVGPRASNRVRLLPLSAYQTAVANFGAVNPEAPLQDPAAGAAANINALANGVSAFLDIEGMTPDMVRWAIWALTPSRRDDAWYFNTAGNVHKYPQWYRWQEDLDDGVADIFLHYGPRPVPALGTPNHPDRLFLGRDALGVNLPANSPWNQAPNRAAIGALIGHMVRKHLCANDALMALDLCLNQLNMLKPSNAPGHLATAGNNMISMFGTRSLQMPRDLTASAYFDFCRTDMVLPVHAEEVVAFLSLTPTESTWLAFSSGFRLAASLNWAAYTLSMRGTEWRIANGQAGNQYQRNLVKGMVSQLYATDATPWQLMHRAACAHMYDTTPLLHSFYSSGSILPHGIWGDNTAPFMENAYHEMWMLKKLPRHMLLPLENGLPSWPDNEPKPMFSAVETPRPEVRVARDLELFTGRAWVQDGGMMANLQFYAASPGARNRWRSDENRPAAPPIELASWVSPFQYEWPANPNTFAPEWLAPAQTPFGAYLLPGSVQNYSSARNRVLATGIRLTEDNWDTTDAWAEMTLNDSPKAVCIAYRPPTSYKVELPPVNDFSMLLWSDQDDFYAGITLVNNPSGVDSLDTPSGPASGKGAFPAHLANHNNPNILGYTPSTVGRSALPRPGKIAKNDPRPFTKAGPTMRSLAEQQANNRVINDSNSNPSERRRPGIPGSGRQPAPMPVNNGKPLTNQSSPQASYVNKNPLSTGEVFGKGKQRKASVNGIRLNGRFSQDEIKALKYVSNVKMNDPPNPGEMAELADRRTDVLSRTGVASLEAVPQRSPWYNHARWIAKRQEKIENLAPSELGRDYANPDIDHDHQDHTPQVVRGSDVTPPGAVNDSDFPPLQPEPQDANDSAAFDQQVKWPVNEPDNKATDSGRAEIDEDDMPLVPARNVRKDAPVPYTDNSFMEYKSEMPKPNTSLRNLGKRVSFQKEQVPRSGLGTNLTPDRDASAVVDLGGGEALNLNNPRTREALK